MDQLVQRTGPEHIAGKHGKRSDADTGACQWHMAELAREGIE